MELNRLPCPNDKMCDDDIFVDRSRRQLTMFEIRVLVGLSRLLHAHITHEIAVAKITARICRFPIVLFDLIRLNSIVLPSPNDKMYDEDVFADRFRYQLTV